MPIGSPNHSVAVLSASTIEKKKIHGFRLPAGIGNRAEKRREHRDAEPGIALDFRPQRLTANRIADDVAAEIGRVDVDGDDEHIGIAPPLVEYP